MDLNSPRTARRMAALLLALGVLSVGGFLAWTASARRAEQRTIEAQFAEAHPGAKGTLVTLEVKGMTCGGCAKSVSDELSKVEGVTACRVDLERQVAEVRLADAGVAPGALIGAVEAAGYHARLAPQGSTFSAR